MGKQTLKRLSVPTIFLLLFLIPALYWDTHTVQIGSKLLERTIWIGRYVIGICLWLTLAWLAIRIIDDILWPLLLERRLGYTIPRLLKDLVRLIVIVVAVGVIISVVFEKSIAGFLAASGVVGLVLGFALRNMIADFFSGIALNLEHSFSIGDRVKLEDSELTGDIVEINWRTTVIKNFTGNYLVVPNSRMSTLQVENFHKPEKSHYNWHFLTLDFDVQIERAERILLAALKEAQAEFGVTTEPIARVRLPNERGMEYIIVYQVPEYRFRGRMRAAVIRCVMRHLRIAGIRPVYPRHDVFTAQMLLPPQDQRPDTHSLLRHVNLFTVLDDSEMTALAERMTTHLFKAGDIIVAQGDSGASMYIVAEGLLYVYIKQAESSNLIKVGTLSPGLFFGETSLLTGEPRTATVKAETEALVCEISKEDMEILLHKRPEIAERLSEVMARYRLKDAEFMQNLPAEQQAAEVQNFAAQLLGKMRRVFGMFLGTATTKE